MAVLLDTSVLIGAETGPENDAAISVVSLTELHFGVLVARDDETRALRMRRLGAIEDRWTPYRSTPTRRGSVGGCTPSSLSAAASPGGEHST